ncbi:MAG TPA: response regulator [Tepidisphaeraceae bacterium]|jgi:CheY-like chemotaxis protein|nr:response regulator [Tepidisphaeraceae bacterium]
MNSCNILVVEDHADSAEMLQRLLARTPGWHVQTAGSIEEAIAKLDATRFDMLLCDLALPDGDGCDLIKQIHDRRPVDQRIKGIAVTGHAYPADEARSRAAGFLSHVTKPYDIEQIVSLLKKHC